MQAANHVDDSFNNPSTMPPDYWDRLHIFGDGGVGFFGRAGKEVNIDSDSGKI